MTISKKIKIILLLLSLSLTMAFMSDTYSRYVADTTGDIEVQFAKWQILVNTQDITSGEAKSIDLQPVVIENEHIAANTFAPSSKGYFDIAVDPTNVNVSFGYNISLEVLNKDMPDLMITQYSFLDKTGVEGDKNDIDNTNNVDGLIENAINEQVLYNKEKPFEPFTIRIYFEWFEGEGEKQDDAADTVIGLNAAQAKVEQVNNTEEVETEETETENEEVEVGKLKIKATISFKQLLESEIEKEENNEGTTTE
ncbi:MAG: hypothetical protein IJA30_05260 [Bacilli bacterium]|nr:hypothetical protein [Bacilli bacterium]